MARNLWDERRDELAAAYARDVHPLRFALVTRALQHHLVPPAKRIIDVGGGYGEQAIRLARLGHRIVVLDPDPMMLNFARQRAALETGCVRERIEFVQGYGEHASDILAQRFDVVCCHSVLMYLENPRPLLALLAGLVSHRGVISILTVNRAAAAMREGLRGNWEDALALMKDPRQATSRYLPSMTHSLDTIATTLNEMNFNISALYGVGIFTDHLGNGEPDDAACELEWVAGMIDPYRQVAHCLHVIFNSRN